ncbi:RDD family protein [Tundrisphaera sp. TA3]|uniref:RDD family protein n=1 Tax=Tundrisphaera sp. TA3 TaxID=3435775 RepID=UPI003EC0D129
MTTAIPEAEPLDAKARLITPERVRFTYPLAGPFRRSLAYLIDLLVIGGLLVAGSLLSMALSLGTPSAMGPILAIAFALTWGYGAFCEGMFNGQTAGKRALGIRVMTTLGVPITGSQAAVRNLVGAIDGWPLCFLPGLACMAITPRFQRLGDLAAGTMVVIEEPRLGPEMVRVEGPAVAAVLADLPLRMAAGPDLARALSDYVRHRGRFHADRREEIARHLAGPLRERHGLPASAPGDAVLCAVYHRVFLGE